MKWTIDTDQQVTDALRCKLPDTGDAHAHFEGVDVKALKTLMKKRLLEPENTQNDSPTNEQFIKFMEKHPEVTAHGYMVGSRRSDARISIEGLSYKGKVSDKLALAFTKFCRQADELEVEKNYLYSWWD